MLLQRVVAVLGGQTTADFSKKNTMLIYKRSLVLQVFALQKVILVLFEKKFFYVTKGYLSLVDELLIKM